MDLYLQMGHGMKGLAEEYIKTYGDGALIISPVNMEEAQLADFSKHIQKINGKLLFDPQMFYTKRGHEKLKAYTYWPEDGVTISSEGIYKSVCRELLRINNTIDSEAIILPGNEMNESTFAHEIEWLKNSSAYFRTKTKKTLLATVCIYPETLRNPDSIEYIVETLRMVDVDGYYVIPHPSNNEYIVGDSLWTIGVLKLLSCLKLHSRKVIVGYSNHQGLMYALSHVDGIATGTFMNTRSFVPDKFQSPRDTDVKHKSVWYYLPSAMCEYKVTSLDVAMQRGYIDRFIPHGVFENEYSAMLFRGGIPSNTNYKEGNSFKHYLHCLRQQCLSLTLSSYDETFNTYEFMLRSAESAMEDIGKKGISGQNRDFLRAIESNRIAICANDEDYGLKLRFGW